MTEGPDENALPAEPAARLNELLRLKSAAIFALPFFDGLRDGLSPQQWRLYAKQFYVTCISFDKLLNVAVRNARPTNHAPLIAELEENLADELGETLPKKTPHAILRKRFFRAIGLPEREMIQELGEIKILQATIQHTAKVDALVAEDSVYTQIGAFVAQEFLASGPGFWILEAGVKKSFPDLIDPPHEAMEYVYGHIDADATAHFPKLIQAISPLLSDRTIRKDVLGGADLMLDAEHLLYTKFGQEILGST